MQTPQTKLENGPYRYFLVGFVADDTAYAPVFAHLAKRAMGRSDYSNIL